MTHGNSWAAGKNAGTWCDYARVENECLLWTLGLDKEGYAITTIARKQIRVVRLVYLAYISVPQQNICHKCDNKQCIAPYHLFEGSARANAWDMMLKNKGPSTTKLSAKDVLEIRQRFDKGEHPVNIAKDFNITSAYAWQIGKRQRKLWVCEQ